MYIVSTNNTRQQQHNLLTSFSHVERKVYVCCVFIYVIISKTGNFREKLPNLSKKSLDEKICFFPIYTPPYIHIYVHIFATYNIYTYLSRLSKSILLLPYYVLLLTYKQRGGGKMLRVYACIRKGNVR